MTSAIPPSTQKPLTAQQPPLAPSAASGTPSLPSGVVPAQLPVLSYANATKTATPTSQTSASAPAHNAKPSTDSPANGVNTMAQGGPQVANSMPNGTPTQHEHGRKPSVVISASGASGYTPNGGPVGQNGRPQIAFGSMNPHGSPLPSASVPYQSQTSSLPAPPGNPRVISPAHSPSPIPQPAASGGRHPPSGLSNPSNGMTFGSIGNDVDPMRQSQMQQNPLGPGMPIHERRASSQSMHGDPAMNRNFMPPGGRGRGFAPQQYGMPSPAQNYRQLQGAPRGGPNMPQFQQQIPPGSPYNRGRNSPAVNHSQPNMAQQHMGNPQMQYGGYPPQMGPQQHPHPGMYPPFDAQAGYYQPYWYQGQAPPQSPRPYPSPYNAPQGPMQPPFHPATSMSRSASQASERPTSSMGQPQTPSMQHVPPPSQTPVSNQQSQPPPSSNFVKPKKTSAIRITDPKSGEVVNYNKSTTAAPSTAQPTTPVIVSTPNAPTPPPRAPSNQHNRAESKTAKSAEETKNAFQEQVKRQMEEKRKTEEAAAARTKQETEEVAAPAQKTEEAAAPAQETEEVAAPAQKPQEPEPVEPAAKEPIQEAVVEAEEAAAADAAGDKEGEDAIESAEAAPKEEKKEEPHEETEDERLEREIAEMEAAEREEEEREKAFQEKRKKEKEEAAKRESEEAAKADEELKRQEREAEALEEQREREREAKSKEEADQPSKEMFAELKKPTLGPGSAPESGTETPVSEEAESSPMPPPAQPASATGTQSRPTGTQKAKPAHLKLETSKRVEPAEPTPGMQALKSARFLEIKEEAKYPEGFKSPNPALSARKGRAYDKDFLLQFQNVFKEKPSVDWDQKVKETLGPGDESARPQSARTPSTNMGGRSASGRPGAAQAAPSFSGPMGSFGGQSIRTLPPGTTSDQRFMAASMGSRPGMGAMPMGGRAPSQLGMGAQGMTRTNSLQAMANMGAPNSPRQASTRGGKGGSRRGDRAMSKKEEAELAAKMPLTAHMEVTPLEKSGTGWKPTSIGQTGSFTPAGNLTPELVQRKVKAALNKMTPENFDKISDQILEIVGQSKNESDGRTLRQVIQLTFEKACDEAHWAGMYARFCHKMLSTMSPEIKDDTIKDKSGNPVVGGALFRKYLLNRCQEEFERGWQVNLPEAPEGGQQEAALLSEEYYVAAAAKRRGLGLIQFIGQLYKLRMLTLRIMHECVLRLLNFEGDPDEAAVENLTTLLRSVGATMEQDEQGHGFLDAYFARIDDKILSNQGLPSRPRFMIMDLLDLRKAGWRGKDDAKGPKTIQQIHAEAEAAAARAEAERQRTNQRGPGGGRMPAGRGDARNFSGGPQPPVDYQRTNVNMDDLRKLQARNSSRQTGGALGPGGSLGPGSLLGARSGSRRGAGNLGPSSSGNTTRTNTPPVENKEKKDETSSQNAFGALAALDSSGEAHEEAASQSEAASPPAARNRSKSPLAADKAEEASSNA